MNELIAWLTDPATWQGETGIPVRLLEHVAISSVSVVAATLIALPVGLWIGHTGRWATLAINVANIGRALPSYAVIGNHDYVSNRDRSAWDTLSGSPRNRVWRRVRSFDIGNRPKFAALSRIAAGARLSPSNSPCIM